MCFRGGGVSGVWSKTILLHFFLDPSLNHFVESLVRKLTHVSRETLGQR